MDRSAIPINPFTVHAQLVFDEFAQRAGLQPSEVELRSASDTHVYFEFAGNFTLLFSESDVDNVLGQTDFDPLINPDQSRLAVVENRSSKSDNTALLLKKYWRMHYCQVLDRCLKDFGFRIATMALTNLVDNNARVYATLRPMCIIAGIQMHDNDSSLIIVTE
jgi:hypothetical protein